MKPGAIPYFKKDFNLPPFPLKLHPPCFIFKSQRSQSWMELAASKQPGVQKSWLYARILRLKCSQLWYFGGYTHGQRCITSRGENVTCVPMNLDILLKPVEIEQNGFVKGAHRLEPCWLVIAKYVCPEDQKVFCGQGKKESQAGRIKKIVEKTVWERTWHSFGICVCFSLEIGWCVGSSFWLLSEIWTSVLLCRKLGVLNCVVETV